MDTKSSPSEMVALMMLIRYYCAACLELIDKIVAKLPPEVAFPHAFTSKDVAPPSAPPAASASPPASSPAPAPPPPPTSPPLPQQPAAETVEPLPDGEPTALLDLRDVRHRITLVAQAGHADEIKVILNKFGASRLSDIDPSSYQELLEAAEALLKGQEVGSNGKE